MPNAKDTLTLRVGRRGVCDPLAGADLLATAHSHAAATRAEEAHGNGHCGHAGMSMEAMVRDMRDRFLVAVGFAVPIAI